MNSSSDSSGTSFLPEDSDPILHKRKLLRERILEEQSLTTEVEQLQRDLELQTRKISDRSEDTIHDFISSLKNILKLDVLVDSFVTEQVDFSDEQTYDLILFETPFDLEDVVASSTGLEDVDLNNTYDINILFLKLQTYYALRYEIFNHIFTLDSGLVMDFIEGTVRYEGKQLLKWDILLSRGGKLVQNKLTTSEEESQFLKDTVCEKGIHKGVTIFVAQLLNLS
ncbi:hypothetical protein ACO0OL_000703 [Hanseniaspora opuntiae]